MPRAIKPAVVAATLLLLLAATTSAASTPERKFTDTQWRIVSMTGFPEDNVVEGWFSFDPDRYLYFDGANDGNNAIRWNSRGFEFQDSGFRTDVGQHEGDRSYFSAFPSVGAKVTLVINTDGSLTMSRDGMVVVGVPAD